jgi:hypothetical protein
LVIVALFCCLGSMLKEVSPLRVATWGPEKAQANEIKVDAKIILMVDLLKMKNWVRNKEDNREHKQIKAFKAKYCLHLEVKNHQDLEEEHVPHPTELQLAENGEINIFELHLLTCHMKLQIPTYRFQRSIVRTA